MRGLAVSVPSDGALPFSSRYRLKGGVPLLWVPTMIDFALARRMMVDGQVRTSDVTDLRIIAAMLALPRERFVSAADTDLAYLDTNVPAIQGAGGEQVRHLLKPMVLAKLIQAAAVKPDDRVLDVGCATGYSAALLARLAPPSLHSSRIPRWSGSRATICRRSARATRRS